MRSDASQHGDYACVLCVYLYFLKNNALYKPNVLVTYLYFANLRYASFIF